MNHNQVKQNESASLRRDFPSLTIILWLWGSTAVNAQTNYTAFELIRENNWDPLILEDLNGDGAKDIVYSALIRHSVANCISTTKRRMAGLMPIPAALK